ncbi:MAG: radical SAM protein, partial [Candidatus Bathyarchaeia archaeon]
MNLDVKMAYRKLRQLVGSPMWVNCPESVQLDTQTRCNLDCVYCNVQKRSSNPKGTMPIETIRYITEYFKGSKLWCIAPFMNGDPLLEERLPQILDLIGGSGQEAVLDTNGTFTKNLEMLIHPSLKLVRFTISASTPQTYEKVHGKPLFETAWNSVRWFEKNKLTSQKLWINYIEN